MGILAGACLAVQDVPTQDAFETGTCTGRMISSRREGLGFKFRVYRLWGSACCRVYSWP